MATNNQQEYDTDFYAWALHSAELIRQGKLSEVDIENVAEEIESMGRRDKRELINRLAVLLAHLVKWQFQPERQGNSWRNTIEEQRFEISDLLNESPSLKYELNKQLEHAYQKALILAVKETGMSKATFPKDCPFSLEQSFDSSFLPEQTS